MTLAPEMQTMKISTPEKVARILEKVASSGIPLILRPLGSPNIAIKGRAIPMTGSILVSGLCVGNISDKGMKYLAEQSEGFFQVEFVLTSAKVTFQSRLIKFNRQDCVLAAPAQLVSIERRKNSRYLVTGNARAFMSFESWDPLPNDLMNPPFWDSTKELGTLIPVADVAVGGISLTTRFPGVCRILDRGQAIESGKIHLPMIGALPIDVSVRWCKRLRESISDNDGKSRVHRLYKFGLQFVNMNPDLEKNIQIFIQRISQADAI